MGKTDPKSKEAKKEAKRAQKAARKEEKKRAKRISKEQRKAAKHDTKKARTAIIDEGNQQDSTKHIDNPLFLQDISCLKLKRVEVTVSLLPSGLANVHASIKKYIEGMIFKYFPRVGILLLYENVHILDGGGGKILDELPHLHYRVQFDGLVFCPTVGCKLKGVVGQSFPSHISVLVFDYFNAMIPSESLVAMGYTYDSISDSWSQGDTTLKSKGMRSVVSFTVDKIHECVGTVSLEGSNPEYCGEVPDELDGALPGLKVKH